MPRLDMLKRSESEWLMALSQILSIKEASFQFIISAAFSDASLVGGRQIELVASMGIPSHVFCCLLHVHANVCRVFS